MDRFERLRQLLNDRCPRLELRERENMTRHTTFRLGGPVRLMALPKSEEEAVCAVRCAAEAGITPFFLGNGSNLLVPDEGVERFVVKVMDGLTQCALDGNTITAGSGLLLAKIANFAMEHNLTGLEFAHGIPGTLGGAVSMNAGAYGGEMKDVVASVTWLDETLTLRKSAEVGFSYRHSRFSDTKDVILSASVRLLPDPEEFIRSRMRLLMEKRKTSQPLDLPSAGSTFKRPAGGYAAAMIDQAGLKGFAIGGAQVSPKHAGFVVNTGNATCEDVRRLMAHIQETVYKATGILLEPEVKFIEG